MKNTILIDDVVNAIIDTVNDSNCEDDAKNVIKTIINMFVTLNIMDEQTNSINRFDIRDYQTEINTIIKKPITPIR